MNRREFCRQMVIAGGAVLVTPVIDACTRIEAVLTTSAPTATSVPPAPTSTITPNPTPTVTPDPTPTPQSDQESTRTKIALVKTRDRAAGVRRAIELLGINPIRGHRVLLKPISTARMQHPAQLILRYCVHSSRSCTTWARRPSR